MRTEETPPWLSASAVFASTRWTVVLNASREGPRREEAMDAFCRSYWYPVYAFIRRRGHAPEDAGDLTQAFFERLIEKDWLARVERRETRFSTLLMTMLKRFLINDHARRHTLKRGSGARPETIRIADAERDFAREPSTLETPEQLFERRWALAVLASALERLAAEAAAAGRARSFEVLSPFLSSEPEPHDYEEAAAALGTTRGAVAVAVHRLRRRYREVLRDEVSGGGRMTGTDDEDPMQALWEALAGSSPT